MLDVALLSCMVIPNICGGSKWLPRGKLFYLSDQIKTTWITYVGSLFLYIPYTLYHILYTIHYIPYWDPYLLVWNPCLRLWGLRFDCKKAHLSTVGGSAKASHDIQGQSMPVLLNMGCRRHICLYVYTYVYRYIHVYMYIDICTHIQVQAYRYRYRRRCRYRWII